MARNFDGVDDIIYSTYSTGITSYNWLVAVWVRTSVASGRVIVSAENASGTTRGGYVHPTLYVGRDGYLRWAAYDGGSRIVTTSFIVTDNIWRNVIGVCMWNNSLKLWVDGTFIGSVALGTYSDAQCWWKLAGLAGGNWTQGVHGYFPGEIANVRIYRFPAGFNITDDMVMQVYRSSFRRQPALRQYLFIWYPLWERGNPSFVLDHSGRYDNGTVIGTTYADDPVQIGGSMVAP
jgi:hypothetical protein